MNYDDYYSEPLDLDPYDNFFVEEDEEDNDEELKYAEAREDFGYFGEMGLWD